MYFLFILFLSFFPVRLDEYVKAIGKGSFGKVYLVRHKEKNRYLVLKSIPLNNHNETTVAQKEVKMMQRFDNPFIVHYFDSFIEQKQFHILMEYCDAGDLNQYFQKCKANRFAIPESVCKSFPYDVFLIVNFHFFTISIFSFNYHNSMISLTISCNNLSFPFYLILPFFSLFSFFISSFSFIYLCYLFYLFI